ncbi:WD repeat-containing protein wdr-5.1 [Hondaea fermentalgiana]|uniref:WD repeat-containing protein wdr-5.1 n=1 Tax=Hondaea fermentalgiana TaxID=2315210 RepID=A0A2R5GE79_9STRA|nr:WD repeat-containing protein wdr-5.1 [Hondaea fermentalgiana]|eukprot:GBG26114.1 WD repeat-containing protein wdr-5.1 [Hondaea fermentalgiana]
MLRRLLRTRRARARKGGDVLSVAQSPELIVAGSDKSLRAWSRDGDRLVLAMLTPDKAQAWAVAVYGDLAVVGTGKGGLFIVDVCSSTVLHSLHGHANAVRSIVFEGEVILSGSEDGTIRLWRADNGQSLMTITVDSWVLGLAAQGDFIAAGLEDTSVHIFDRATGERKHILSDANDYVRSVAIDTTRLVSGSDDRIVRVYVVPSFELVHSLRGHSTWVLSVALQGERIVSGSADKTIRVWDARTGTQLSIMQAHSNWVKSVSLLDQEIVSGSLDRTVRVWDLETGTCKITLNGTEPSGAAADVFSSDSEDSQAEAQTPKALLLLNEESVVATGCYSVLEAINQRRADNEQSTLIALQSSLAYLRKSVMQSPEMEHAQDSLLAALATLEECSINARGTPTCFAAQYAEQATRDQAIEIEQLQRDLDTANGMDLMSSFDDLKLMEANKDHATALAKHRTLELTAVEQKLQQTQDAAQSLKHNLEHTHGKFNDATSELAALRRENEALRAHIENPSEKPIPSPVAKTNPSFDDTPEGGQGRHAF